MSAGHLIELSKTKSSVKVFGGGGVPGYSVRPVHSSETSDWGVRTSGPGVLVVSGLSFRRVTHPRNESVVKGEKVED